MSLLTNVVCDGYVKYEEAEVVRSVAILKTNNCGGGVGDDGLITINDTLLIYLC